MSSVCPQIRRRRSPRRRSPRTSLATSRRTAASSTPAFGRRSATRIAPLAFALAAGCSFDTGGSAGVASDAGGDDRVDAASPPADAADCPAPLFVSIAVNGATSELGAGEPYARVLVGDTVTLSAAGSCVRNGPISYQWQISPLDATRASALPDLSSPEITVYSPVAERDYTVRLTITDGAGATTQKLVYAFATHGWQPLDPPGSKDAMDVHFGGGALWVGTADGAFRYAPDDDTFESLADDWSFADDEFSDKIEHVWFDDDAGYLWLGHKDARAGVWRGAPGARVLDFIRFDDILAIAATTQVNEIGPAHPGVRIATDFGASTAEDNSNFLGKVTPIAVAVETLAQADDQAWIGGAKLWKYGLLPVDIDPFGTGLDDSKIVGMASPPGSGELWLVSDDHGVATASAETGQVDRVFTEADGLPSNKVRDLVFDSAAGGDVWVVTQQGVARYKRDRARWLVMGPDEGLGDRDDLRAITVDPATRAFYAAGSKGLVYIRAR